MKITTRIVLALLFLAGLATVLYFTLVPNIRGRLFYVLPRPIAYWCGSHDNLANIAAFAVLGTLGYWASRALGGRRAWLIAMLVLVCGLEFAQLRIEGRNSSLWDVVMGWTGVLGAWFGCVWIDRRLRKPPASQ